MISDSVSQWCLEPHQWQSDVTVVTLYSMQAVAVLGQCFLLWHAPSVNASHTVKEAKFDNVQLSCVALVQLLSENWASDPYSSISPTVKWQFIVSAVAMICSLEPLSSPQFRTYSLKILQLRLYSFELDSIPFTVENVKTWKQLYLCVCSTMIWSIVLQWKSRSENYSVTT